MDLLFYNGYKKSPDLTSGSEDEYVNWDNLYKSYLLNKRSFANEYKTIRIMISIQIILNQWLNLLERYKESLSNREWKKLLIY